MHKNTLKKHLTEEFLSEIITVYPSMAHLPENQPQSMRS
jgi:hypothetical protein